MNVALILLAGKGERFSSSGLKQFYRVNDKDLFLYTLDTFNNNDLIDKILLVVNKEYISYVKEATKGYLKVIDVISGGESRQLSSFEGLKYLKSINISDDDHVLIHDGARANVSYEIINDTISKLQTSDAVRPSIKVEETYEEKNQGIVKKIDGKNNYLIQTPQSFRFGLIYEVHHHYYSLGHNDYKDDCSMVEDYGYQVDDILGSKLNLKITTKEDLEIFISILNEKEKL